MPPPNPPTNAESVAGFNQTIPIAVEALEARARDVESVAVTGEEAEVVRAYAAARFFVAQVDVDMRVLLRAMASDPSARLTTEKLLALVLREAIDGVYKVLNELQRTARTQSGRFAGFVDVEVITEAQRSYKAAVQPIRDANAFLATLTQIRNEVAAHMFSDDSGIESAAAWVVSRSVLPKTDVAMFGSLIFSYSIEVLRSLHDLDLSLAKARKF